MTDQQFVIRVYTEMTPSPTDPANAGEFYKALGTAIVAFGRLEGHFAALLLTVLNVATDPRIGRKFPMAPMERGRIWRLAFKTTNGLQPQAEAAEAFISGMENLAEHRNNIDHGLWEFFRPEPPLSIDLVTMRSQPKTPDGLLYGRGFIDVGWRHGFIIEANRLNLSLLPLGDALESIRGPIPANTTIL